MPTKPNNNDNPQGKNKHFSQLFYTQINDKRQVSNVDESKTRNKMGRTNETQTQQITSRRTFWRKNQRSTKT